MHSAQNSDNSAAKISWKYLGLGIIVLVSLVASLTLVEIPSFNTRQASSPDQSKSYGTNGVNSSQSMIWVEIRYNNRTEGYQLNPNEGLTAFTVLNSSHRVKYKQYEQGYFLTAIDGIKQNQTHSWLYFVNGQPPTQAVNNYQLKGGDKVSFRYLGQEESKQYFESGTK